MKLLIVEDEIRTREMLETALPWGQMGIGQVRAARNGLLALELAREWSPDIILCDVRMPKMNGIEFAGRYREMNEACRIIFLSGFSDKEYLKAAINLKALSYIEKPIRLSEVRSVVEEAVRQLQEESMMREAERRKQAEFNRTLPYLRSEMVRRLITDPAPQAAIVLQDREMFLLPPEGPYTVAAASVCWNIASDHHEDPDMQQEELLHLLNRHPLLLSHSVLAGFDSGKRLVLIVPGLYKSTYREGRKLMEDLDAELRALAGLSVDIGLGVGEPAGSITEIPVSYASACTACSLQFYGDGRRPLFWDSLGRSGVLETDWTRIRRLRELLRGWRLEEARQQLQEWTAIARLRLDPDIVRVKDTYHQWMLAIEEWVEERRSPGQKAAVEPVTLRRWLDRLPCLDAVERDVMDMLDASADCLRQDGIADMNRVGEMMAYIRSHSQEKGFTIRRMADHYRMNETYLCAYFKKHHGRTIKEYMTEIRMNRAKELLQQMDMKLYEVADSLGFADANYFTTYFKRYEGCTPSEYREKVMR